MLDGVDADLALSWLSSRVNCLCASPVDGVHDRTRSGLSGDDPFHQGKTTAPLCRYATCSGSACDVRMDGLAQTYHYASPGSVTETEDLRKRTMYTDLISSQSGLQKTNRASMVRLIKDGANATGL